jgi:hypothetical protein
MKKMAKMSQRKKHIAWEEERRGKDGKYVTIGTSTAIRRPKALRPGLQPSCWKRSSREIPVKTKIATGSS